MLHCSARALVAASSLASRVPSLAGSCSRGVHFRRVIQHVSIRAIMSASVANADTADTAATSLTAEAKEGIALSITEVQAKMKAAVEVAKANDTYTHEPRLVAVSKTKPLEAILAAYAGGQRHFGENYVQELVEKASSPDVPADIQWHFIGTLQSNKVKHVASIERLAVIETISTVKLANAVDKAVAKREGAIQVVDVFVQVNTSAEEKKGGISPDQCSSLVKHINDACPHLRFAGLMTIGEYGRVMKPGETNPDFQRLVECRTEVAAALNMPTSDIELSMGMSGDYEHAISIGSTNVRVGSTIFGARQYKNK